MTNALVDSIQIFDEAFRASPTLMHLGYGAGGRKVLEKSEHLPPRCRFSFRPSRSREVVVDLCHYESFDRQFFTVEIFNIQKSESFLIDEWLELQGITFDRDPLAMSSYTGTPRDRARALASFLDVQFGSESMTDVLMGKRWDRVSFNWGNLK